MIEFINVKNFKTLLNASFPLGSLNLLSGLNGMGKSTMVQSLLLLRQSHERNTLTSKGLLLNGDYVSVGTGGDALSTFSEHVEIVFTLKWSEFEKAVKFKFDYQNESDLLPLQREEEDVTAQQLDGLSLFNSNFQYLSADRLGPQSHHVLSQFHIHDLKSLGHRGEFTVHFIAENGARELEIEALQHPEAVSNTLLANIEAWMSDVTPGLKVRAVARPEFNSASLGYAFRQGKETTKDFKPQNVGFGLSYALPVVTSVLSASKGDLLIIENPESHLHPAGQSLIGKLCAIAAKNEVQIIAESHSDHFLNGMRVAVKQEVMAARDVKVFFLHRDIHSSAHASEVICPNVDDQGLIDCWPDGFFDQWDKELDQLL